MEFRSSVQEEMELLQDRHNVEVEQKVSYLMSNADYQLVYCEWEMDAALYLFKWDVDISAIRALADEDGKVCDRLSLLIICCEMSDEQYVFFSRVRRELAWDFHVTYNLEEGEDEEY